MNDRWSETLKKALPIVEEVGDFILQERKHFAKTHIKEKSDKSLVSYVDTQAEERLISQLSRLVPQADFLSEESHHTVPAHSELYWVIDPLDGTTNYVHDVPFFCVSVALLCEQKPVIGIIYAPSQKECFYATATQGAYGNQQALQISPSTQLSESLVATGFFSSHAEEHRAYLDVLNAITLNARGFRRLGSAAMSLAYVACGRFDAFFDFNLKPWDMAAGILLVQEAGGHSTDMKGQAHHVFGKNILAAGKIYPALFDFIQAQWPFR